jgi:hypothetical protein
LFASSFIPEGTVIGELVGRHVGEDGPYVLWLDESQGFCVENEMRYINHSLLPNSAYYDDLTVVALRDIEPGEEITHNYLGDEDPDADEYEWDFSHHDSALEPVVSEGLSPQVPSPSMSALA